MKLQLSASEILSTGLVAAGTVIPITAANADECFALAALHKGVLLDENAVAATPGDIGPAYATFVAARAVDGISLSDAAPSVGVASGTFLARVRTGPLDGVVSLVSDGGGRVALSGRNLVQGLTPFVAGVPVTIVLAVGGVQRSVTIYPAGKRGSPVIATPTPTPGATARRVATDAGYNTSTPYIETALAAPAYTQSVGSRQVVVDSTAQDSRSWIGVGASITDATAYCLATYMTEAQQNALLQKVFVDDGFSMVRICMGDSDFSVAGTTSPTTYATYNDVDPATSVDQPNFSIAKDFVRIIPILKKIKALNPGVKIFASPWSPPAVLKGGQADPANPLVGGNIVNNPTNFAFYATYFLKFLQAYQAAGITVDYVSVQNEPNYRSSYTSCLWSAADITAFIGGYLGPKLASNGFGSVKIISGDCAFGDSNGRDTAPLADATAGPYTAGAAHHGYTGSPTVVKTVADAYPSKELHHSEISFNQNTNNINLGLAATRYGIDVPRNGAQSIIWWNLALDPNGQPGPSSYKLSAPCHISTAGVVTYRPEYAVLAHLGRTVQRGAKRIASTQYDAAVNVSPISVGATDIRSVAWMNPDGSRVCFVYNGSSSAQTVSVIDQAPGSQTVDKATINSASFATVLWPAIAPVINPALPPALSVSASGVSGQVRVALADNPPANGGSAITGYNVYGGTTSGQTALLATNVTLPYLITGLTDGTTEYVKAAAVTSNGSLVGAQSIEYSAASNSSGGSLAHYLVGTNANTNPSATGQFPINTASVPTGPYLDIDVYVNPTSITPSAYIALFGIYNQTSTTASNSNFQLVLNTSGTLGIWWLDTAFRSAVSTVALSTVMSAGQDVRLRVKLNVGTTTRGGLAPGSAQFLYSLDGGATYKQLGDIVTGLPTAGFKANTGTAPKAYIIGKFYKLLVQDEAGKVWYNPDVTAQTTAGSFQDTAASPNTWTMDSAFK